jgi:hypothetical protein
MSVRPPVYPSAYNSAPTERISLNLICESFSKIYRVNQGSLKSDKKTKDTVHEDQSTLLIISHSILLRTRNVSDKRCRENQ